MYKKKQPLSLQEVLSKLMSYCSYQERSLYEAKQKAKTYDLSSEQVEQVIKSLLEEGFINEQRFGEAYVKGKVNVKRWGRYKIKEGLVMKGLSEKVIIDAIKTIDEGQYWENLIYLIKRKLELKPELQNDLPKMNYFLRSKGYEGDLIYEALKDMKKD